MPACDRSFESLDDSQTSLLSVLYVLLSKKIPVTHISSVQTPVSKEIHEMNPI